MIDRLLVYVAGRGDVRNLVAGTYVTRRHAAPVGMSGSEYGKQTLFV